MQSPGLSHATKKSALFVKDNHSQLRKNVSTIRKSNLFEKDKNNIIKDNVLNLPNAPKKTKFPMKSSKRKRIFGLILKNKEQKVVISESFDGETADFVCVDNNTQNNTQITKRKLTRAPKGLQSQAIVSKPSLEHSYEMFPPRALKPPSSAKNVSPRKDCTHIPSVGINYDINLPIPQRDIAQSAETMTEISALTMTSPLTKLGNFAIEARRRRELQKTVVSSTIRNGSYAYGDVGCVGLVYPSILVASSKSSLSSPNEFSLECIPQVENVSSLSSQSTGISGSSSSCSASTPVRHNASGERKGTQFASRAAKRMINGVQGMVAGCFAPISSSPTAKVMNKNEWNAFCQMSKEKP